MQTNPAAPPECYRYNGTPAAIPMTTCREDEGAFSAGPQAASPLLPLLWAQPEPGVGIGLTPDSPRVSRLSVPVLKYGVRRGC